MKFKLLVGGLGLGLVVSGAWAQSCTLSTGALTATPFSLNVANTTVNKCANVTANTADSFFNALQTNNIEALFPGANKQTDKIGFQAGFNSLLMTMDFAQNSNKLDFAIPGLGVSQSFTGANRDASVELLRDYLKKDANIVSQILNYQAKNSPFSPISGDVGLIPVTLQQDFASSFTDVATNIAAPAGEAKNAAVDGSVSGLLGASVGYSSMKINDVQASMTTLPLSYTFRNDVDPRRQVVLQMPLGMGDVAGAKLFNAGLGAAYRMPMNDNWTLAPGLKFSFTGSADLAAVAGLWSGSLASTYIMRMDGYDLAIGNMLGLYKTVKLSAGDYSFDPGISTTGLRNGIMYSKPVTISDRKMSLEYSLIDARYFGDKPFSSDSQELGVTLGTNKSAFSARSFVRAGLTYTTTKVSKGWALNLGYWF